MKLSSLILLIGSVFILTACPGNSYQSSIKAVQGNHMDLTDLHQVYYNGVSFQISSLFKTSYNTSIVLQDNAMVKMIFGMDVYFSIEKFSEDEAFDLQFTFEEETDEINAVHDYYAISRANSLENPTVCIKKEVPKTVKHEGIIQVIHGSTDPEWEEDETYLMATLAIGDEYYVVQMIGMRENMGYLYDDFIDMLNSFN